MTPALVAAQDRAHLIVTLLINGDHDAAAREWVDAANDAMLPAMGLALADCVAFVCHQLALEVGLDDATTWQQIATEVIAWREGP